mmetsp:Transcript_1600/g.4375  ORF Transcript_1600/g.4375 Transcript_1600/m.4375 type:complete len:206 (+) Transcript_1600:509-1126(+)
MTDSPVRFSHSFWNRSTDLTALGYEFGCSSSLANISHTASFRQSSSMPNASKTCCCLMDSARSNSFRRIWRSCFSGIICPDIWICWICCDKEPTTACISRKSRSKTFTTSSSVMYSTSSSMSSISPRSPFVDPLPAKAVKYVVAAAATTSSAPPIRVDDGPDDAILLLLIGFVSVLMARVRLLLSCMAIVYCCCCFCEARRRDKL